MIVVHIESGLGNQMLGYAEYLALKKMNPNADIYIETMIYDVPEAEETIKQWNGYELNRIFGIDTKNIKDIVDKERYNKAINKTKESKFWLHNWDYSNAICNAIKDCFDITLVNNCKSNHKDKDTRIFVRRLLSSFFQTSLGYNFRRMILSHIEQNWIAHFSHPEKLYFQTDSDLYCGFTLLFKFQRNNIELIEKEIRKCFVFPEIDEANLPISQEIQDSQAIAIHVRRGDMLNQCNKYYKGGYFKRAVGYIRKHVLDPVFFVFSDPGSEDWVISNLSTLGLTKKDSIKIITWNKELNSFRDMQLISLCKHAIITVSSFGWWGAFLISNPQKITISPEIEINTTYHC